MPRFADRLRPMPLRLSSQRLQNHAELALQVAHAALVERYRDVLGFHPAIELGGGGLELP